jgi:hypothetical protein
MGLIDKKTGAGRKRFMEKAKSVKLGKRLLIPIAIGIAGVQALKSKIKKKEEKNKKTLRDFREQKKPGIPSQKTKDINKALNRLNSKKMGGGMMKRPMGYTKGGGADTGRIGELKSKIGVLSNKLKRRGPGTGIPTSADIKKIKERLSLKNLKQAGRTGAVKLVERSMKILKDNKKMGGGMMKKYNKGGGADTGKVGEIKSQFGVTLNRVKRYAKKIKDKDRLTARDISTLKELTPKKMFPPKKMGGGMMKRPMGYTKGGGADTGRIGELKSKIGVLSNKLKRRGPGTGIPTSADMKKIKERLSLKNLKQAGRTGAVKLVERSMKILKDNKKMGGGMMQRPMGMMKKGQMVKARGGGMARIKPTKMF